MLSRFVSWNRNEKKHRKNTQRERGRERILAQKKKIQMLTFRKATQDKVSSLLTPNISLTLATPPLLLFFF